MHEQDTLEDDDDALCVFNAASVLKKKSLPSVADFGFKLESNSSSPFGVLVASAEDQIEAPSFLDLPLTVPFVPLVFSFPVDAC